MKKPRYNTAIRFTPDVRNRLVAEAESRDVSINWLVNRAVEYMLANIVAADDVVLIRSQEGLS